MRGMLSVERMVLESVAKEKDKIKDIAIDTGLSEMFVRTLLSNLRDYGLVSYKRGSYELSEKKENLIRFNQRKNVKAELKDLFGSLVDNHYSEKNKTTDLKMQKIWLTDYEYKVLKSHMDLIDKFIKSVRKDRQTKPEEEILAEQRVIFWGSDTYSNLIAQELGVA